MKENICVSIFQKQRKSDAQQSVNFLEAFHMFTTNKRDVRVRLLSTDGRTDAWMSY
jgi:hypothetical protein